jgi:uncharacterized protein
MNSSDEADHGSTVVIHHRVRRDRQAGYEEWLNEIAPLCKSAPGCLDWQIIRPVAGVSENYSVVIRFDTQEHLRKWMSSDDRQRLIGKVRPLLAVDDAYRIHSGLDFLFAPVSSGSKVPARWKQFLVTWSAIYPLALGIPLVVGPLLNALGVSHRSISTLVVTGLTVAAMVYLVMPHYTKLVRKWLYGG